MNISNLIGLVRISYFIMLQDKNITRHLTSGKNFLLHDITLATGLFVKAINSEVVPMVQTKSAYYFLLLCLANLSSILSAIALATAEAAPCSARALREGKSAPEEAKGGGGTSSSTG